MTQPTSPLQPQPAVDEASSEQLLALASSALRERRLGEVEEIRLAVQWAVLHGEPRHLDPDDRSRRDPMVIPGGDGTPPVREHAIAELAMARSTHPATTRALIADGLDLVHRLPRTWMIVQAGDCEPWVARKVAVIARSLLAEDVHVVDAAVARAIAGHAPSTVLEIARAKTIEADPATHHAEQQRIRHERYVRLSRSDAHGYRHLIARITAGDAAVVDAMVDRVADILTTRPDLLTDAEHNNDELRSLALGWLARPVDLLQLLLEHTETDTEPAGPDAEDVRPVWAPAHLDHLLDRLAGMSTRQLAALRPRVRLFVHLTDDTLRALLTGDGTGTAAGVAAGVARIEGVGPLDARQLHEVLGHTDITLTPVLDLAQRRRVDAYEHPETIKDHAWTLTGGDCYPYSPRSATRDTVDYDHAIPFDDTGPPGQTGTHNCGPLRRSHHRTKTPLRPHHPRRRTRPTPLANPPQPDPPRRPPRHHHPHPRTGPGHGRRHHRRCRALLDLTAGRHQVVPPGHKHPDLPMGERFSIGLRCSRHGSTRRGTRPHGVARTSSTAAPCSRRATRATGSPHGLKRTAAKDGSIMARPNRHAPLPATASAVFCNDRTPKSARSRVRTPPPRPWGPG